jgi:hypothetical protein
MLNINIYNFRNFSYTSFPQKLVVNSTFDNVVFVDNQSILFISNLSSVKPVIIEILKDGADVSDSQDLGKSFFLLFLSFFLSFFSFFSNLESILSELKDDCYSFDFYFYIESPKESLFDVFTFNPFYNINNFYVKKIGSFGYFKVTSIKFRLGES